MRLLLTQIMLMCLLYCVASPVRGVFGDKSPDAPLFCHKTVEDEPCILGDCTRMSTMACYHGDCSDTGDCVCVPCWRGPSCDEAVNEHAPVFTQTFYEEYISPDEPKDYPFMYIRATDKDEATCGASNAPQAHCPCSEVLYSLDDEGEDENGANDATFVIDPKSGGISVAPSVTLTPNTKHRLKAYARNPTDGGKRGTVPIVVIVSDVLLNEQSVKLRKLQAAPEINVLDANQTLAISFLPSSEDAHVGALSIGSRVDCVLTISIPESVLVSDINVEIFTDDENNTLSVICPPAYSKGGELQIGDVTQEYTSLQYTSEDNPFLWDSATFGFSNVTNLNTSTDAQDSKIVITFSITLKEDTGVSMDERYWVSAGVEYSSESKLWIGQIGFLIDQEPQYAQATNITLEGPAEMHKGEVEVFNLDLNVYKSVANLTVQAAADSAVKDYLLICGLHLCNTGTGFCLDVNKDLATFQVDMISQNVYQSVYGFGNIVNGGTANSTADSRISMDVVAFLRDDSGLMDDSSQSMTATANDGDKDSMDSATFMAKANRKFMTPGKTLEVNTTFIEGDNQLFTGECVKVRVALHIPASTSIAPVSITLSTAANEGTDFQFFAVLINHIGYDISCLLQRREEIEGAAVFVTDPAISSATINLQGIANTGSSSTANGVNDIIGVDFVVMSAVSDAVSTGTEKTLAVTVDYANDQQLTESVTTVVGSSIYPTVPQGDPSPFTSTLDLLNPADPTIIAQGEVVLLAIRPVIVRGTQYRYVITSLANTTGVSIIDMKLEKVGSHIPSSMLMKSVAVYDPPEGLADSAEMDLGMVYNYARPGVNSTEEDGLLIRLVVLVTEEVPDSVVPVAVSVLVGSSPLWVAEGNITVSASEAKAPRLPDNNTLVAAPTYTTEVMAGSETILRHTIIIPEGTTFKYIVNYTTEVPWIHVTNVNLTTVGVNLVCTKEGQHTIASGSSGLGAYTVVDLGYVCNVPNGNETKDNVLEFELTVSTLNSSDVDVGLTTPLKANVEISNAVGDKELDVEDIIFYVEFPESTFKLCCPESAYYMRPGEIERCNITMTILDSAINLIMELDTPFNDTAAMTLINVEVGTGGFNTQFDAPEVVFESSGNTSQNNMAKLDFGRIVNTGAHTEQAGNLADGDNDIPVYIDVQMSDSEHNVNGSYHALESGISISGGAMVWVAYYKLTVIRDGSEKPSLNVSLNHNGSDSTYSIGDKVWYQVDVSHTEDSYAEAVNVQGHVFLPPFIQFDSMTLNQEPSSKQPAISPSNDNTGFYFTVPRMFFTDRLALTLETSINPNYRYKLTKDWKGTTPIEVIYYMTNYDVNHYIDGQYFHEPMDYTTFDFKVPYPDIPGQTLLPVCDSPTALGLEDGSIPDCQITASFAPEPAADAHYARLNGASAWKTPARAGPFLYDRWIKVDLGKRAFITGIQTQGGSSANADGDLGEFEVLYSLDDTLYKAATPSDNKAFDHQKDVPANHDVVVSHTLLVPVEARYVILNLTAYDYTSNAKWYNALRMEILGCEISGSTATDTCPTSAAPLVTQPYQRGFLVDVTTDTLFVCDTITHGESGVRKEIQASVYAFLWKQPDMHCFMMIHAELQWTGLDPRLRAIVGFLPSTGRLYGFLGNSPNSYAASDKPYTSWFLIERSIYEAAAASDGFVTSVSVPFVSKAAFSYSNPDTFAGSEYAIGDWKATVSGIFKGSEKVMDWNECCQPTCSANGGKDDCS